MATKRIQFQCTAFRDGFQSAFGARVQTDDFIPALEAARDAGITWFEAGGGARFQSLYFYCQEDAFDMMDRFRRTCGRDANLQTLARGVNVVGLDSQPSDIIKLHAELFKKHGISTIRNFDALNDVENLKYSGQCIHEAGLHHQICVTLMELPPGCSGAHDAAFYLGRLRQILDAEIPFDSVCFKDASGTAVPSKVYETIKEARKLLGDKAFIHFHTHDTAGIGVAGNTAAIEAGADAICLSLAPCSGGTCQPDVLVQWHALRGMPYDLGVDVDKIREAERVFAECMEDYFLPPEATMVEPLIPWSPMPGGALTANTQMLRDNGLMDRYTDIIRAMREVVERGGFGTSVTPVSQFYFQQAFANVMHGPWKQIARDYGRMVLGYFGKTPVAPDPQIVKLASEQLGLEPTDKPVLELNDADPNKGVAHAKALLVAEGLPTSDENIFIAATCLEKGIAFLKGEAPLGIRKVDKTVEAGAKAHESEGKYVVSVDGKDYRISFDGNKAMVGDRTYHVGLRPAGAESPAPTPGEATTPVSADMPGLVLRLVRGVGDTVKAGDELLVLEAMKMEIGVASPVAGELVELNVKQGDQVKGGTVLARIRT